MPTLQGSSVKVDEQQLLELASIARKCPFRRGSLHHKSDGKGKKFTPRWCYIYQNMMFYYETESSAKPLGMVLLEGCVCKPLDLPDRDGAFSISIGDEAKGCVFSAASPRERTAWIEAIEKSSMSSVQQDLLNLQQKYSHIETQAVSSSKEVEHLKLAHEEAQVDIAHLRASIRQPRGRSRSPSCQNIAVHVSNCRDSTVSALSVTTADTMDTHARILQHHIRGWLIYRRWRTIVRMYMDSPHSAIIKKRNQLIWRFVATEEDYVALLSHLHSEFQRQFEIAASSKKPPLTMEQCTEIFRNCDGLLLFHQLFLRGLHSIVEQWPVVKLGGLLRLFIPMLEVYSNYIGNQKHALDVLFQLKQEQQFRAFLTRLERHISSNTYSLEELLLAPLSRVSAYMQDLQELKEHTPAEHVDYPVLTETVHELQQIQKVVTEEVNACESFRQVLKVEHKIEGGCDALLDKDQILLRKGFLQLVKEDKATGFETFRRNRYKPKYCFLFSKHLLVTSPQEKKGDESYRLVKDIGVLPLALCRVHEKPLPESDQELSLLGFSVEFEEGIVKQFAVFLAPSVAEKVEWVADIAQCIENETQLKLRHALRAGDQDANCKLHYSDHRSGKERIVNYGSLSSLLDRLVNVSYFGLDFLNTFLMTFRLFTSADVVMKYLLDKFHDSIQKRSNRASCSSTGSADDTGLEHRSTSMSSSSPTASLGFSGDTKRPHSSPSNKLLSTGFVVRTKSESASSRHHLRQSSGDSVSGIIFAVKHWICKHYQHFLENPELDTKLHELLKVAVENPLLTATEIRIVNEMNRLYEMQKLGDSETSQVIQYMTNQEAVPPRPFEVILLWESRQVAEQLCLIESDLFRRVGRDEMIRYLHPKGKDKAIVAPNLAVIFQHFNRMSTYWMWSVAMQRYDVDRVKVLEFLVLLGGHCWNLNNYTSLMQIMAALEHGTVLRFKQAWEQMSKAVKMQLRYLKRLSSADSRYKELREAMKKASPPMVPYIGTTLSELVSVSESQPTHMEGDLINFSKMRKYTKLVLAVIQHQKDPYQFSYIPEILKVLLCTKIPGTEDDLYDYIDKLKLNVPESI